MAEKQKNLVHEMENFRQRIRSEQLTAKKFNDDYGFLATKDDPNKTKREHSISPVKYHRGGTWTVKEIRVPFMSRSASVPRTRDLTELSQVGRPLTALEATQLSHQRRTDFLRNTNVHFLTTSKTYGSRISIEQFGVSQFGIVTSRSRLPPN